MREPISASTKLALTLRFLATGDSYKSLMYLFRISDSCIALFVPTVCRAIAEVLREYIKVSYFNLKVRVLNLKIIVLIKLFFNLNSQLSGF